MPLPQPNLSPVLFLLISFLVFLSGLVWDPARRRVDLLPAACPHVWENDSGSWSSSHMLFCLSFLLFLCMNPKLNPFLLQVSMFCYGARVGFYQGDISLLMDDIKTLKPTFFPVVPRLLNRIYDKVSKRITRSSFSFTRCKVQQIHPLVKIMHQYSSLASAGSPGAVRPLHGPGFNPSWGYFLPAFPLSSRHCCIAIKLKSKKPHKIDWFKSRLIFLLR